MAVSVDDLDTPPGPLTRWPRVALVSTSMGRSAASPTERYTDARRLLRDHRDQLDAIVAQLLVHETLDEPYVYAAAGIAQPQTAVQQTPLAPPAV